MLFPPSLQSAEQMYCMLSHPQNNTRDEPPVAKASDSSRSADTLTVVSTHTSTNHRQTLYSCSIHSFINCDLQLHHFFLLKYQLRPSCHFSIVVWFIVLKLSDDLSLSDRSKELINHFPNMQRLSVFLASFLSLQIEIEMKKLDACLVAW